MLATRRGWLRCTSRRAVLAYPADRPTTGRAAIQAVYQRMVDAGMRFGSETPLPTVRFEDLALTSTRPADNTGVRVQVLRRQPDGSWLRIIDPPRGSSNVAVATWSAPVCLPLAAHSAGSRFTAGGRAGLLSGVRAGRGAGGPR